MRECYKCKIIPRLRYGSTGCVEILECPVCKQKSFGSVYSGQAERNWDQWNRILDNNKYSLFDFDYGDDFM